MKKYIALALMIVVVAACGGCLKTLHVTAGGIELKAEFVVPGSYRLGSFAKTADGDTEVDLVYFDTPDQAERLTPEELALLLERRLAQLQLASEAAEEEPTQ